MSVYRDIGSPPGLWSTLAKASHAGSYRLDMEGWAAACFRSQENRPKLMTWGFCKGCGALVHDTGPGVTVETCQLCAGATGKGNDGQQTEAQAQADGQP